MVATNVVKCIFDNKYDDIPPKMNVFNTAIPILCTSMQPLSQNLRVARFMCHPMHIIAAYSVTMNIFRKILFSF